MILNFQQHEQISESMHQWPPIKIMTYREKIIESTMYLLKPPQISIEIVLSNIRTSIVNEMEAKVGNLWKSIISYLSI